MAPAQVLFVAHGSPLNALGKTAFGRFCLEWGRTLNRPRAVLVISAHWEAGRLAVTGHPRPSTMHDFAGFPEELYALQYPAPGDARLAGRVAKALFSAGLPVELEPQRGLDHGAWGPLRLLFPRADVPVLQLSLYPGWSLARHRIVGRALAPLLAEGVLLLGSGNLVHSLATADLTREQGPVAPWAAAFDSWVAQRLAARDLDALTAVPGGAAPHARIAVPTPEHFAPLLVCAAAAAAGWGEEWQVRYPYTGFEHGTLSLRCVEFLPPGEAAPAPPGPTP